MNRTLKTTLLTLMLALGLTAPASAQMKIGTVNLRSLFDGYWKTKQADTALKASASDLDKEFQGLMDNYKTATADYKELLSAANDQARSTEERDKQKKAAEDKLVEVKKLEDNIKQFKAQATENLDTQRRRMRENVLKEIRKVVDDVAKADSYDLVIDTAADSINSTPVVIYSTGVADLTDRVLAKLNADKPADMPDTLPENPDDKEQSN